MTVPSRTLPEELPEHLTTCRKPGPGHCLQKRFQNYQYVGRSNKGQRETQGSDLSPPKTHKTLRISLARRATNSNGLT